MGAMTILRVLTTSERISRACPRLWGYKYKDGLVELGRPSSALIQGSLVHRLIDTWAMAGSPSPVSARRAWQEAVLANDMIAAKTAADDAREAETLIAGIVRDVADPWLEERVAFEAKDDETHESLHAQSVDMFMGYVERWHDDAGDYETIAVEAEVARWLRHPKTGKPILDFQGARQYGGSPRRRRWSSGGKLDRLVRKRSDGTVWVIETKTTKDVNLDAYAKKLHLDPQIRTYPWALAQPIPEATDALLRGGFKVEGVILDVLRKAVPRAPEVLKSGKGISRAAISTTRDLFMRTVLEHGFSPDDYADHIASLPDAGAYFHREHYDLTPRDFLDYEQDAAHEALRASLDEREDYLPRQTSVCQGVGRFGCPGRYEELCAHDTPLMRAAYERRPVRHPELSGPAAEPWVGPDRQRERVKEPQEPEPLFGDQEQVDEADPFIEAEEITPDTVETW